MSPSSLLFYVGIDVFQDWTITPCVLILRLAHTLQTFTTIPNGRRIRCFMYVPPV